MFRGREEVHYADHFCLSRNIVRKFENSETISINTLDYIIYDFTINFNLRVVK
jgi:hypothetical protein